MPRSTESLLDEIESDALDGSASVAGALRKCLVLGGRSGSDKLTTWAKRELEGYGAEDDLPPYRVIHAVILVNAIVGNAKVTRQQFPPSGIPKQFREDFSDEVKLQQGLGELEAYAEQAVVDLAPSGAADLARYMNETHDNPYQYIESLYWSFSGAAFRGVLDRIRTAMTHLVVEIRANTPEDKETPSAEVTNHAVTNIYATDQASVNVATSQTGGSQSAATASAGNEEQTGFWTRWRKIGAFVVGLAAIAGAVFTGIDVF